MHGIVFAEESRIVNALPPVDITGGAVGQAFKLSRWVHASIVVAIGVSAAAPTAIRVQECTAANGADARNIAFSYYAKTTSGAANDVFGSRRSATSAGITDVSGNDDIGYVIEVDAADLSEGYGYLRLAIDAPAQSILASALVFLTGGRFSPASAPSATV